MKKLFFFLLLFFPFLGISQSLSVKFDGAVSNFDKGSSESGVTVSIIQNGQAVSSATTSSNGRYSVKGAIDIKKPFDVVFKKSGFVSKKVSFNFIGLNLEDTPAGDFKPVDKLDLDIFAERPGLDFSFLNTQSVGEFTWNSQGYVEVNDAKRKAVADKIDNLLKKSEQDAQNNQAAYNAAIQAADKAFNAKDYTAALAKYEEATKYKPKETYPIQRIDEIDALLQKQKEDALKFQQENAAYLNLIKAADNFFKLGDYEKAKQKYYEASDISDEQYPLDQIKEINRLVKEKENEAKYKQLIEAADLMVKQKSFRSARDNYNEALKLKPNEAYPKQKISEIDAFIKAEEDAAAKKEQYNQLVAAGDQLVKEEKWEEAKTKFDEALKIEPASTYAKGQLDAITKKLAEIKAAKEKADKIAKILQEGDKAIADKTYDVALTKFKEVLTLDNTNTVAPTKIAEVEGILAQLAKDKELLDQFNALVKQGDDAKTAKKYQEAIAKYQEAIKLKQDPAVDIKIQEAQKLLSDLENAQKKEAEFAQLIAEGASAFTAKDYTTSLAKYEAALVIKPADTPTQTKIGEIRKLIAEQKAASDKQAKIEQLLQEGTTLMEGSVMDGPRLSDAKSKFNEVLTLDAKNATAITKIAEIDKLLKAQQDAAASDAKFNDFVTKGDASVTAQEWEKAIGFYKNALAVKSDDGVYAKMTQAQEKLNELADLKKKEESYQAAITEANTLRDAKKYTEALVKYEAAKAIKPTEAYPQEQITKINQLLADQQSQAQKLQQITALLAEGEKLFAQKDFANAKTKYEQVLAIEATNDKALARIKEIDSELAKLAASAEKAQKISTLLQEGESLFNTAQYDAALPKFNEVLSLDKDNSVAKNFIAQIATKKNELQQLAEKDAKFNQLVTQGDASVAAQIWQEAITAYTDALKIKADATVEQKLSSAKENLASSISKNELLAKYNAAVNEANALRDASKFTEAIAKLELAKNIKPDETYPQQEIDRINQLIATSQKNSKVTDLLIEAQNFFSAKDYQQAQAKYLEVLALDKDNTTAKSKLDEIKNLLDAQAKDAKNLEAFNQLKAEGFKAVASQDYPNAISNFEQALKIKDDAEVKAKLAEIKTLVSQENQKSAKIQALLAQGEAAFKKKEWGVALGAYQEVLTLETNNSTARSQIAAIESEMAKAKDELALSAEFNRLKAQGFSEANAGEYVKAKHSFEEALKIKSDNEVSKKLQEIEQLLAKKAQAEKTELDYKASIEKAQIAEAAKQYSEAINHYKKASELKPLEELPKTKIEELTKLLQQQNALSEKDKKYNELLAAGDELVNKKDYVNAIQKYNKALEVKPNEELPVIKAKHAEKLAQDQIKAEQDAQFEKIISAIKNKISDNDFSKARDYIKTATNLRPSDPRPKEYLAYIERIEKNLAEFNQLMKEAQEAENNKKYSAAIASYEKAKALIPENPTPQAKIDELKKLLSEKDKAANLEATFNQYFNAGVTNQKAKEYELALNNFKNALNLKPNDANTLQKIAEVEALIAQLDLTNKAQKEIDAQFNSFITEADENFYSKNYQKAGELYRKALTIKPDNQYAIKQLKESERLNKLDAEMQANEQYQKILDVADQNFNSKDYEKALEYYNRALRIKSTDPYPKSKIDEINAILNPTIEESAELQPLGEPFDGSILDGEVALKKAEETRKDRKRNRVVKIENKALTANAELTAIKKDELKETIGNIYNLYTQLIVEGNVRTADKLVIKSKLEEDEQTRITLDKANENYERNSNLAHQSILEDNAKVVSNDYQVSTKKQEDIKIDVDKIRIEEQDKTRVITSTNHQEGINTDVEITTRKLKIEADNAKSIAEQIAITEEVNKKRTTSEDIVSTIDNEKYNKTIEHKNTMEGVQKEVSDKTTTSINDLKITTKEFKTTEEKIVAKNAQDAANKHHESIGVKEETIKIEKKSSQDDANYTAKRVETSEVLKTEAAKLVKDADVKIAENATKNSNTKELIVKEEANNSENSAKAVLDLKDKAKEVNNIATTTTDAYSNKSSQKDQELKSTQRDLDFKTEESRQRAIEETERTKEKGELVKEKAKELSNDNIALNSESKQSALNVKKELTKAEETTTTKIIVPNSLGEKYPEGVSQEMFQRKDDAGILSAIITRRIVVVQGRGDEYVRTQTSSSITYTKNGTPITEYVWQKETQDAKLQRHY